MRSSMLRSGLFLSLGLLTLSGATFATPGPHTARVNCAQGMTLEQALGLNPRPLIVEFTGVCAQDVTIPGDDITLRGADAGAAIIGTVTIDGRARVRLEDFTVRDTVVGPPATRIGDGIVVLNSNGIVLERVHVDNAGNISMDLESSTVHLIDCTVTRSRGIGVAVALNSTIQIFNTLSVTQGSGNGIMATDGGDIQFSPRVQVVSSNNAGSGLFVQEKGHVTFHGRSRLTASGNAVGVNVVDHGSVVSGGTIEASGNLFLGVQVGQLSDWTLFGGVTPTLLIQNNGGPGLVVNRQSFVRMRENTTITGNAGPGVVVDGAGTAIRGATIQGNNNGNGDVVLVFGTNATFDAPSTIGTPIFCDGTVLTRGAHGCGAPLTAAQTTAATAFRDGADAAVDTAPDPE